MFPTEVVEELKHVCIFSMFFFSLNVLEIIQQI